MDEIILIGAGGHARSCIDVIELTGFYKIVGLVEKDGANVNENLDYPIIGTDDDLQDLRNKYAFALVTVGQIKSPMTRIRLFRILSNLDYKLPVIVSPRSYVSKDSKIGPGTIIMHDVILNANAKVGKNCIINNKVLIDHDAVVGDQCHIATGAIVNGEVNVGSESFIGSGVVTKQSIVIGSRCVIGAGAVIKADVESNQVIKN
ncbi:MAG: acetyltransferase [Candidatus Marinimicrobia bacterium]|nr:acetyltransferase [Candidatus Neomarinimicrobiota bacterium]|tara:strand:+ start:78261 stop:78872 length:612 start_codon:yes stop_codon:yes gene_type:complete